MAGALTVVVGSSSLLSVEVSDEVMATKEVVRVKEFADEVLCAADVVVGALTVVVGSSLDDSDVSSALAVSVTLLVIVMIVFALVLVVVSSIFSAAEDVIVRVVAPDMRISTSYHQSKDLALSLASKKCSTIEMLLVYMSLNSKSTSINF